MDRETGEVLKSTSPEVPDGSIVFTPQQAKKWAEKKQREAEKKLQRMDGEHFYFTSNRSRCGTIKPQTLARLFFLATYLRPGKQELYLTERKLLAKTDLPDLMKLSAPVFYRFWSEVNGEYLTQQGNGAVTLCDDFFRGIIKHHEASTDGYQRVYIESLRQLYWQTPINNHKYLGYLFLVLPHINHEWNVLCKNPSERDLDQIEYMSLREFCVLVGWNPGQLSRVIDAYRNLVFEFGGKRQYACSYLRDSVSKQDRLVINPQILYRGSHPDRVMGLGVFFPQI